MSRALLSPRDFIVRALAEFRKQNPNSPFMPLGLLSKQMNLDDVRLTPIMEQLSEAGLVLSHPMWPHIREVFITEAFHLPER